VPFFEGRREDFADFSYKLLEHNIDDIIFNPAAFQKQCEKPYVRRLSGTLMLTLIKISTMSQGGRWIEFR
jgi:hypothetical protein